MSSAPSTVSNSASSPAAWPSVRFSPGAAPSARCRPSRSRRGSACASGRSRGPRPRTLAVPQRSPGRVTSLRIPRRALDRPVVNPGAGRGRPAPASSPASATRSRRSRRRHPRHADAPRTGVAVARHGVRPRRGRARVRRRRHGPDLAALAAETDGLLGVVPMGSGNDFARGPRLRPPRSARRAHGHRRRSRDTPSTSGASAPPTAPTPCSRPSRTAASTVRSTAGPTPSRGRRAPRSTPMAALRAMATYQPSADAASPSTARTWAGAPGSSPWATRTATAAACRSCPTARTRRRPARRGHRGATCHGPRCSAASRR